jgi:hypothetical protein
VKDLKRWTLVAEFDGGTYIRQVVAASLDLAVEINCLSDELDFWTGLLDEDLEDLNDPTPIDGVENVWCISGLFNDQSVLVHVVLTCD